MGLNCPFLFLVLGLSRHIGNHQDLGSQKRPLPVELQNLKPLLPVCNDVKPAIFIALRNLCDFRCASDFCNPLIERTNHSECGFARQAFADHFLVAWLEDVQGQSSAGEQDNFQREQRQQCQSISCVASSSDGSRRIPESTDSGSLDCTPDHVCYLDLRRGSEYNAIMQLQGKVIVVTGASMGIGEAIAKVFADQDASVVLLSRDAGRAETARVRIGHPERTIALACDVRNVEEIDRVIGLTLHHFQRIDVWVNNAGHGLLDSVSQLDIAACHDLFETNFFGAVAGMQAAIRVMQQQGAGAIINISSVAGHIPLPFHAAYSATKFALNAIGKGARAELKNSGIQVLTVCPGYVQTAFGQNAVRGKELKQVRPVSVRGVSPERVARATLNGYLKQKREVIVPWTMHIPVKLYQLFPGLVEWGMRKMAG
jgi:short-subunit dehydrogenase